MTRARRSTTKRSSEPPRFLLVDDDVLVLRTTMRLIRSIRPEWEVVCVTDADAALQHLATAKIDVLVTDLSMTGLSGEQLIERVHMSHPNVTCVIHSTEVDAVPLQLRHKVHALLRKPISAVELCDALQAALKTSPRQSERS